MSFSNSSRNFTTAVYRDTLQTAIIKNVITVVLCITINYVNCTLVHTFTKHQVFNMNPRYILFIHLVINDIILLTLFTLIQVLSYIVFTLNTSLCIILLMIAIFANLNNPLTLALMAFECYVAICFPLHHSQICTIRKTYVMIVLMWLVSLLTILPDLVVTAMTEPSEFFRSRVFCLRENIFKNTELAEKQDVSNTIFLVMVWLILFYTYFRILFAAQAAAADTKKARNTVLLHGFQLMLCTLTYMYHLMKEGLTYLFPKGVLDILFTISIFVQVLPRLISPVVYGVRDKMFRKYLKRYLFCASAITRRPKTSKRKCRALAS